jgi:hypothetical protein
VPGIARQPATTEYCLRPGVVTSNLDDEQFLLQTLLRTHSITLLIKPIYHENGSRQRRSVLPCAIEEIDNSHRIVLAKSSRSDTFYAD